MNYKLRQKHLQQDLAKRRLDAFLITHLPNVQYLCGFTGSAAALLVTAKRTVLYTDGRYTEQARAEASGTKVVISRKAPAASAAESLSNKTVHSRRRLAIGVEGEHLTLATFRRLKDSLSSHRLVSAPLLVEGMRTIKDADEIALIRSAVQLGSRLFDTLLTAIRPGVKEIEVAAELEHAALRSGAQGMSFSTIIASGERSALPHGRASSQPITPVGFVVCDFGVILTGYCSDMTRTVHVGQPSQEARGVYGQVLEAQQAASDAVKPGRTVGEVDRAARKILQKGKLGRYFTHSTGHGVGLEIHEAPRVAADRNEVLRPGMVITIEPGVYIPGKWGVRIEDMVVVTEGGCEVLTPTSKELIAL